MLSMNNSLKTLIRRTYVLKVNGGGHRVNVAAGKMLQTFEDCVFQQIDKKFISSMDYDKKITSDAKYYQINNKMSNSNMNRTENELDMQNYSEEYEVS